jgi:YD repeat-containing protein
MSESLRTNGHPVLRIERRLKHPAERVWRAITEPAELSQWYPFRATAVEPRVGGRISFDAGPAGVVDALVTEAEPPRVFAFRVPAGDITPGGREGDNVIQIELRPEAADGCLLIFTHTFVDLPAAASYAAGWQTCLDAMDLVLDGRPVEVADISVEVYERYVEKFGLDRGEVVRMPDGWRARFERQLMYQPVEKVLAELTRDGQPLEYEWTDQGNPAGTVSWEVSEGPGGARVVLTQTGRRELADDAQTAGQERIKQLVERLRAS